MATNRRSDNGKHEAPRVSRRPLPPSREGASSRGRDPYSGAGGYQGRRRRSSVNGSGGGGWSRGTLVMAGAIAVVTLLVLTTLLRGRGDSDATADNTATQAAAGNSDEPQRSDSPTPKGDFSHLKVGELPPGGPFTSKGTGKYRTVGAPGPKVGKGKEEYTYVIEVEEGINPGQFGGDDAFASVVDATLANPKSWIGDPRFSFRHIAADSKEKPDLRIQLSSTQTTHEVCGNSYKMETSCYMPIGNRVVLNESRWIRGASPFDGDIGAYRQYMVNHEVGHGIGYAAHQPCEKAGALAPIMMQQTLSLNNKQLYDINPEESYADNDLTCRPNSWVFPYGAGNGNGQREAQEAGVSPSNRPNDQR